jgi:integrase
MSGELIPVEHETALSPVEVGRLDENPAAVYLASLGSANSRRVMRQSLDVIAGLLSNGRADALGIPWGELRYQHTAAIRSQLAERYSAATANRLLSALRGTLRAAWRLGYMTADEYQTATDLQPVKGSSEEPRGRALSEGEKRALLTVCMRDNTPAGYRDAAILALALGAGGLRRAELIGLDLADFAMTDEGYARLVVRGKGNKTRIAILDNGPLDAMRDWLNVRGDAPGPLFVAINKGGRLAFGDRMSPQAIYGLLKKRGAEAGIADFSPHDLRRTFVSDLLDAGADIATVAKLAGHANVQTTARYDRRPEAAKRKALGLLHFPYRRRKSDA